MKTLMTYRVKNITIAVVLALVAALLTMFYTTNFQRNVREDETNVPVFVAVRDIPAGTSGADVERRGLLKKSEVVRRNVVPGAISKPSQVAELIVTQPIYAGEQVSTRRFATPSQRGIKAQLTGVQRAIAVAGDQNMLLAGTLSAGDHVDVIATFEDPPRSSVFYTRIVLRDIPVLRAPVGGEAAQKLTSGGQNGAYAVMLRVTDSQVQKLHWVYAAAEAWHLELRSGIDAADSPENVESSHSLVREGVSPKQLEDAGVAATAGGTR
jgi:Flp pilus assembly protein CpaB